VADNVKIQQQNNGLLHVHRCGRPGLRASARGDSAGWIRAVGHAVTACCVKISPILCCLPSQLMRP